MEETQNIKDDKSNKENSFARRKKFWKFWALMLCINIGFFAVIGRLFWIQIIKGSDYKEKARRQHESKVDLGAQRGNIYDRMGRLLASTVNTISIAVDPKMLEAKEEVCKALQDAMGIPAQKYLEKINTSKGRFVWLARGIPPEKTELLRNLNDKGLIRIEEPTRRYFYGSAGSQIIGCTDIDNRGLNGVEITWDSALKGRNGYMMMYKDGRGDLRYSADLPVIPAIHGYSIQLTLDIELQRIAEYELMQGVIKAGAESGTVIAIAPGTGEILAMANYPNYNPNLSSTFTSNGMRNRAITDAYEPGSTFKMVTAAAALEEKITDPTEKYNGFNGEMRLNDYVIRDVHPLGIVTFREAVENSSNIVFSTVASKIPDYKFYKYIRDFGFGIVSEIDLPGEIPGRIQKAEQINSTLKRYMGFGYGLMATPLQIVNSYATIANKGVMMKPYVVQSVFDEKGEKVKEINPKKIRRVVSENTAATLNDLLYGVVERGTGKGGRISGMNIAAKTGTSQQLVEGAYSKADYTASYVGYFPADNPKVALLVILDKPRNGYYGGSVSAPIFRNIALRWISITPDFMSGCQSVNNAKKLDSVYVPQLSGLSVEEAASIIQSIGLRVNTEGLQGSVTWHYPKSGVRIARGAEIKLETASAGKVTTDASGKKKTETPPNVVGLSIRRAVGLMQNAGYRSKVKGSGKVFEQKWEKNSKGEIVCVLMCK